jgi:hypothetical protein
MKKEENYSVFYSVSQSKKINAINIESVFSPRVVMSRTLSGYTEDEELHRVVFFDGSKQVITCATSKKVVVSIYELNQTPSRIIDVGFDMIGDIILMPLKFFGVTHP